MAVMAQAHDADHLQVSWGGCVYMCMWNEWH